MKERIIILFILSIIMVTGVFAVSTEKEKTPEEVIDILEKAIKQAEENGNYKCCIEPACKMCYLGNWKFEKGTCFCDDAVADGRYEDVCPECKKDSESLSCDVEVKEDEM